MKLIKIPFLRSNLKIKQTTQTNKTKAVNSIFHVLRNTKKSLLCMYSDTMSTEEVCISLLNIVMTVFDHKYHLH